MSDSQTTVMPNEHRACERLTQSSDTFATPEKKKCEAELPLSTARTSEESFPLGGLLGGEAELLKTLGTDPE